MEAADGAGEMHAVAHRPQRHAAADQAARRWGEVGLTPESAVLSAGGRRRGRGQRARAGGRGAHAIGDVARATMRIGLSLGRLTWLRPGPSLRVSVFVRVQGGTAASPRWPWVCSRRRRAGRGRSAGGQSAWNPASPAARRSWTQRPSGLPTRRWPSPSLWWVSPPRRALRCSCCPPAAGPAGPRGFFFAHVAGPVVGAQAVHGAASSKRVSRRPPRVAAGGSARRAAGRRRARSRSGGRSRRRRRAGRTGRRGTGRPARRSRSRLVAAITRTSTGWLRGRRRGRPRPLLQHAQQLGLQRRAACRRSRRGTACRRRPARTGPLARRRR